MVIPVSLNFPILVSRIVFSFRIGQGASGQESWRTEVSERQAQTASFRMREEVAIEFITPVRARCSRQWRKTPTLTHWPDGTGFQN